MNANRQKNLSELGSDRVKRINKVSDKLNHHTTRLYECLMDEDRKGINFNCDNLIDLALEEKVRIGRAKDIHNRVISFIEKINDTFGRYEPESFGCWKFHLVLSDVFGGEYYYNSDHVITKINDKFYDINGEVEDVNGYLDKEAFPLCFMLKTFKKQEDE